MIPKLVEDGLAATEICIKLNTSNVTVRSWVEKKFPYLKQKLKENGLRKMGWNIIHGGHIGESSKYKHKKDKCEICGSKRKLVLHHKKKVVYNKVWNIKSADNSPENLQTLCSSCHLEVHYRMGRPVNNVRDKKGRYMEC